MRTESLIFAADATWSRADLRVDGDPEVSYDPESEIVVLDQLASTTLPPQLGQPIALASCLLIQGSTIWW